MKKSTKLISMLLAIVVIGSALPLSVIAQVPELESPAISSTTFEDSNLQDLTPIIKLDNLGDITNAVPNQPYEITTNTTPRNAGLSADGDTVQRAGTGGNWNYTYTLSTGVALGDNPQYTVAFSSSMIHANDYWGFVFCSPGQHGSSQRIYADIVGNENVWYGVTGETGSGGAYNGYTVTGSEDLTKVHNYIITLNGKTVSLYQDNILIIRTEVESYNNEYLSIGMCGKSSSALNAGDAIGTMTDITVYEGVYERTLVPIVQLDNLGDTTNEIPNQSFEIVKGFADNGTIDTENNDIIDRAVTGGNWNYAYTISTGVSLGDNPQYTVSFKSQMIESSDCFGFIFCYTGNNRNSTQRIYADIGTDTVEWFAETGSGRDNSSAYSGDKITRTNNLAEENDYILTLDGKIVSLYQNNVMIFRTTVPSYVGESLSIGLCGYQTRGLNAGDNLGTMSDIVVYRGVYKNIASNHVGESLVSIYDGSMNTMKGHDVSSNVWQDLISRNYLSVANNSASSFSETAYMMAGDEACTFPENIKNMLNSKSFTMEFSIEDLAVGSGDSLNIFSTSAEEIKMSYTKAEDALTVKLGDKQLAVSDVADVLTNAVLSVTYENGGDAVLYVNGFEVDRVSGVSGITVAEDSDALIGGGSVDGAISYRSVRFYERAIDRAEIRTNAVADGLADTAYVEIAQPMTNIVGDVAVTRKVNSADEFAAMMGADELPAAAIFTVDENLSVLDSNGDVFATVEDILLKMQFKVLPVFVPTGTSAVAALTNYLNAVEFYDASVMSNDAELLKAARTALTNLRGVLDLTDEYDAKKLTKEDCINIRKKANIYSASVVMLPANALTNDTVQYLYNLHINVWAELSDTPTATEKYEALMSGAVGVVSDDTQGILDIACNELSKNTMTRKMLNIGHRGSPDTHPENTIEGSLVAYENGANCVEMDVYMTTDGVPVVIHDNTTGRTCNADLVVEQSTWAQLSELMINEGTTEEPVYTNQIRIPQFEDYLKAFKELDCQLYIELKSADLGVVAAVKELIEEYDMYDQCIIITSGVMLAEVREVYPEMTLGYVTATEYLRGTAANEDMLRVMELVGPYNATYNPHVRQSAETSIRAALLRGICVSPWAAYAPSPENCFIWGYSGITTDNASNLGNAVLDFYVDGVPTSMLVGESFDVVTNLITYAHQATTTTDVKITFLEGESLVAVNGMTFTALNSGRVTFVVEHVYTYGSSDVALCTQPISLNIHSGRIMIEKDGEITYYDTLAAAFEAAESGNVVKLVADHTESAVTLAKAGVVLDLNGKKLTVDTIFAVKGTSIVDTSDRLGRLVVNNTAVIQDTENAYDNDKYIAMHLTEDDDANTYAFVPVIIQAKASELNDSEMSVKTRPVVDMGIASETTAMTNEIFGNGILDNGLSVKVRVSWTDSNGSMRVQELAFSDTIVMNAYSDGKAIAMNMSGVPSAEDLTVTVVVASSIGMEVASTVYSAK